MTRRSRGHETRRICSSRPRATASQENRSVARRRPRSPIVLRSSGAASSSARQRPRVPRLARDNRARPCRRDLVGEADLGRDHDRQTVRHGLEDGVTEILAERGQHEERRRGQESRLLIPVDRANEAHSGGQSPLRGQRLQARREALLVAPRHDQRRARDEGESLHETIEPLLPAESARGRGAAEQLRPWAWARGMQPEGPRRSARPRFSRSRKPKARISSASRSLVACTAAAPSRFRLSTRRIHALLRRRPSRRMSPFVSIPRGATR